MLAVSTQTARVKDRLDQLGISAATLCALARVSSSAYSNALRGIKPLDSLLELRLVNLSVKLAELAGSVAPLKLPGDAVSLSRLLSHVEENKITSEEVSRSIQFLFGQ